MRCVLGTHLANRGLGQEDPDHPRVRRPAPTGITQPHMSVVRKYPPHRACLLSFFKFLSDNMNVSELRDQQVN